MGAGLSDEDLAGRVVAGAGTHADTHHLCVPGEGRRVIRSQGFPADAKGYAALAEAAGDPAGCAAVGAGGTRSLGAGLADEPRSRGFRVFEVPGPKKDKRRRGEGEDDAIVRRAGRQGRHRVRRVK